MEKNPSRRDFVILFIAAVLFFIVAYIALLHIVQVNLRTNLLETSVDKEAQTAAQFTELYLSNELSYEAYLSSCEEVPVIGNGLLVLSDGGKVLCSVNTEYEQIIKNALKDDSALLEDGLKTIVNGKDSYICSTKTVEDTKNHENFRIFVLVDKFQNVSIIDTVSRIVIITSILAIAAMSVFFIMEVEYVTKLSAQRDAESAEKDLRDKVLAGMSDALLAVDCKDKISFANSKATALHLTDPQDGTLTDDVISSCLADARKEQKCKKIRHELGGRLYEVTVDTYIRHTDRICAIIILHDITEAVRTDSMRNAFVANVSHELRTPLTVIKGFAQNLEENYSTISEEKKLRYCHSIVAETDRLSKLVTDMLFLSKLDSGVIKLEIEVLDISYCAEAFREYLHTICESKSIRSSIYVPEQALAKFDYDRFRQILVILSDNATKFTPEGGTIDLCIADGSDIMTVLGKRNFYASDPQMDLCNLGDRYFVYVEDSGCGISKENLSRIFDRFYTLDKSHNTGTGLGLSLADEMIRSVGETMIAASTEGEKTLIGFTLRKPTEAEIAEADAWEDEE